MSVSITSVFATAFVDEPLHDSPALQSVFATAFVDDVFTTMPPNTPTGSVTSTFAQAFVTSLGSHPSPAIVSTFATAFVHRIDFIGYIQGFTMGHFLVIPFPDQTAHDTLNVSWSDTSGYSWSEPVKILIGRTGEYYKNLSIWRLGYARSRIFRLNWATNRPTALTGAFLNTTIAES